MGNVAGSGSAKIRTFIYADPLPQIAFSARNTGAVPPQGGGHLNVQQHEGESHGVPGQVCPEQKSSPRGGHQRVL